MQSRFFLLQQDAYKIRLADSFRSRDSSSPHLFNTRQLAYVLCMLRKLRCRSPPIAATTASWASRTLLVELICRYCSASG